MTDSQKPLLYRYILITVLLLAVYGNTLNHGFVWDDVDIIVENSQLEKLSNIPKFFLSEDRIEASTGYYRPITYVSFALDRAIWGLNPLGFNITNLVLHIMVALIFYRLVAALFKRENLALVAALIFSLHPIVCETVNFHAGGRNTLLCACFALLSLLFYIKNRHLPAIATFMLAIFSKEFAILLPAIFLLYDRTLKEDKTRWINYLPYAASAVCYLVIRSIVVTQGNLLKSINFSNFRLIPKIVVDYLKNMVFPLDLKTMYDVNTSLSSFSFAGYSLLLAGIILIGILFRKKREILFSVFWFLLFLLPVTNIFNLGTTMMADRYAYFALFGFSIALAYCICLARTQLLLPIMVLLCALLISIDVPRNSLWKDELSFFTQMTKDAPEMCIGFQNLGYAYYDRQDFANAEKYLTTAYTKKGLGGNMLTGSASMFLEMGKPDKAIDVLQIKIKYEPNNPQPYIMAGQIYEKMGNKALATAYHDKAVALSPGIFEMMRKRVIQVTRQGETLMSRHNLVYAERLFKEALSIDPLYVPALVDMGSLVAEKGDLPRSVRYFTKAAAIEPLNPAPHYNLSLVYESLRDSANAQAEMSKYRELEARSRQNGNVSRK